MTEKDNPMVGVEKLEAKPIREWQLHNIYWHLNPRPVFLEYYETNFG